MQDYMLKIPVELHKKIKVISVVSGITMRDFIVEAIKEKVEAIEEKEAQKGVK